MEDSGVVFKTKKILITGASICIFIQGLFTILIVQLLSKKFLKKNSDNLQHCLNKTKELFIILLISIIKIVAPSSIRITTDNASIPKGTFSKDRSKNRIVSHLNSRSVMISNHQIYTDWVFLWWVAYTSDLAGSVYIMLKKSLAAIPAIGYGMTNYKFIFLSRRWASDKLIMNNQLGEVDADARGEGLLAGKGPISIDINGEKNWDTTMTDENNIQWPYNLILFPEGTNLSKNTREKSAEYAAKINMQPYKNLILPRTTGLRFTLQKLRTSIDSVYDITIGYSGVKQHEYGELIYTLPNIFLKGQLPKLVDIHIRDFKINEIPIDDEEKFSEWLFKVWREKDELLDIYYEKGSFIDNNEESSVVTDFFKIGRFDFTFAIGGPIVSGLVILFIIKWMYF